MKKFTITFVGRKIGAIGIFYPIKFTVEAATKEDALTQFYLRVYEHYEHITKVEVSEGA